MIWYLVELLLAQLCPPSLHLLEETCQMYETYTLHYKAYHELVEPTLLDFLWFNFFFQY